MNIEFEQSISRWDYFLLSQRRWPMLWAEAAGGLAPSWWLRLLAWPVTAAKSLRPSMPFPIVQRLGFSERGVFVAQGEMQRQLRWADFSSVSTVRDCLILCGPQRELLVFTARLPEATAVPLRALIQSKLPATQARSNL